MSVQPSAFRAVASDDVRDQEVRSALRFVVHPTQVLTDQPEEEQLHSGEEGDRNDECGETLRRVAKEDAREDRVDGAERYSQDERAEQSRREAGEPALLRKLDLDHMDVPVVVRVAAKAGGERRDGGAVEVGEKAVDKDEVKRARASSTRRIAATPDTRRVARAAGAQLGSRIAPNDRHDRNLRV